MSVTMKKAHRLSEPNSSSAAAKSAAWIGQTTDPGVVSRTAFGQRVLGNLFEAGAGQIADIGIGHGQVSSIASLQQSYNCMMVKPCQLPGRSTTFRLIPRGWPNHGRSALSLSRYMWLDRPYGYDCKSPQRSAVRIHVGQIIGIN